MGSKVGKFILPLVAIGGAAASEPMDAMLDFGKSAYDVWRGA